MVSPGGGESGGGEFWIEVVVNPGGGGESWMEVVSSGGGESWRW